MEVTTNHALLAAGGALALTLYSRGMLAKLWQALQGEDVPLALDLPASGGGASGGGSSPPPGSAPPPASYGAGGLDFAAAGNAVIAEGTPGGGSDWLNWCLNWVNRTLSRLGRGEQPLTLGTAQAACNQFSLRPGPAPKGAIVCFDNNHIGLANGNNTYTSAGLIHGGLVVADYLSNPHYSGWSPT